MRPEDNQIKNPFFRIICPFEREKARIFRGFFIYVAACTGTEVSLSCTRCERGYGERFILEGDSVSAVSSFVKRRRTKPFSSRCRTVQWFDYQSGGAGLTPRRQQTTQLPCPLPPFIQRIIHVEHEKKNSSAPIQDFITLHAKEGAALGRFHHARRQRHQRLAAL